MSPVVATTAIVLGVLLGVAVPTIGMRMLLPSLREGTTAENYRGRKVFLGLGVVWLIWSGCAILAGLAFGEPIATGSMPRLLLAAGMLSLVAFSLGAVDDAFGTAGARGFKGHLRALAKGRLTTGGLKLFGISLASYLVALLVVGSGVSLGSGGPLRLALALPAGAAIALTSNLVNLTDLRPGRALKTYVLLAVPGAFSAAFGLMSNRDGGLSTRLVDFALVLAFLLGPVVATWRYDVGELGMLGDAGANPAGAVAGLMIVSGLPLWATGVYLIAVLWLNVMSERVSFSAVIEGNAFLRRLDTLGRPNQ